MMLFRSCSHLTSGLDFFHDGQPQGKGWDTQILRVRTLIYCEEQGNDAFKAGDYATAVGHYTSAMFAEPNNATYPLNRAAAYLKLDKYDIFSFARLSLSMLSCAFCFFRESLTQSGLFHPGTKTQSGTVKGSFSWILRI